MKWNRNTAWLLSVIALAAALRFYRLDAQSMWFDEAARLLMARAGLWNILTNAGRDTLPPFYHLTLHVWSQLGSSDFWLRLPSAFAGLLLVPVVYRLALALFDRQTAVIAALVTTVLPYQVFQAQQAGLYSYLALFSGLQMLFFWLALQHNGRHWWLAFVGSVVIGLYTHYFAALVTLTLHFWLLIRSFRHDDYRQQWRSLLLSDGMIALAFLPQLATFLEETGVVTNSFWLTRPSLLGPLTTIHLFTAGYSLPPDVVPIALLLVIGLLMLAGLELAYLYRHRPLERTRLLLIVLLAFLPIIIVALGAQFVPIYLERTLIITAPAYSIFLARVLASTHWKSPIPYVASLTGCILLLSFYHYYFNPTFAKPNYRQAAAYVTGRIQSNEVILHTGNGSYIPFLLYREPDNHFLLHGDPAPHHPPRLYELAGGRAVSVAELANYERVWLVVALDHSIPYQQGVVAFFDGRYPLVFETEIDGIFVRQYDLSVD